MRRLIHIFLLLCLPLYGFAMQGALPQTDGNGFLAYELEHEDGFHHHDDDGSVHYDDSDESLVHALDHSSSPQPFSAHVAALAVPLARQPAGAVAFIARAVPEPFLDGPRKPPRSAPGHAAGGMTHA